MSFLDSSIKSADSSIKSPNVSVSYVKKYKNQENYFRFKSFLVPLPMLKKASDMMFHYKL